MELSGPQIAIAGGLVIGAVLGATIARSNFCMMGAVADFAVSGDLRRLRAWMLTIALAILGTQGLAAATPLHLEQTAYLASSIPALAIVAGGLMFGFGMVIACGCASRNLVNAAMGDLRALITLLIMGIVAYATMRGLLAYPRIWLSDAVRPDLAGAGFAGQGLHQMFAGTGDASAIAVFLAVALSAGPLLLFAMRDASFRSERRLLVAAPIIAACIVAGWYVNGILAVDDFDPVPLVSLRFVAPVADGIQYLMTFTGAQATFGIASVGGMLVGAWLCALASGTFTWRAFEDIHDFRRYTVGGALMGLGGVLCMGCTVGQGLTGVSTLSLGSFLALASIVGGGMLGMRYLEYGSVAGMLRSA